MKTVKVVETKTTKTFDVTREELLEVLRQAGYDVNKDTELWVDGTYGDHIDIDSDHSLVVLTTTVERAEG